MNLQKPDILIAVILILLTTLFVMRLIKKIIISITLIGIATGVIFIFMQSDLYRQSVMPAVNSFLGTDPPVAERAPPPGTSSAFR